MAGSLFNQPTTESFFLRAACRGRWGAGRGLLTVGWVVLTYTTPLPQVLANGRICTGSGGGILAKRNLVSFSGGTHLWVYGGGLARKAESMRRLLLPVYQLV